MERSMISKVEGGDAKTDVWKLDKTSKKALRTGVIKIK